MLALAGLPFDQTVDAVAWVTAAELALILLVLLRISRRVTGGPHMGVIAFAGIAANPLVVSTIGLEGHLSTLFMLTAVALYLDGRWTPLGATLGAPRPDPTGRGGAVGGHADSDCEAGGGPGLARLSADCAAVVAVLVGVARVVPARHVARQDGAAVGRGDVPHGDRCVPR